MLEESPILWVGAVRLRVRGLMEGGRDKTKAWQYCTMSFIGRILDGIALKGPYRHSCGAQNGSRARELPGEGNPRGDLCVQVTSLGNWEFLGQRTVKSSRNLGVFYSPGVCLIFGYLIGAVLQSRQLYMAKNMLVGATFKATGYKNLSLGLVGFEPAVKK